MKTDTIGKEIEKIRKARKLSRRQVAEACGVSESTVWLAGQDDSEIAAKTQMKIYNFLKTLKVRKAICDRIDCGNFTPAAANCCEALAHGIEEPCKFMCSRAEWLKSNQAIVSSKRFSPQVRRSVERSIRIRKEFWADHPLTESES